MHCFRRFDPRDSIIIDLKIASDKMIRNWANRIAPYKVTNLQIYKQLPTWLKFGLMRSHGHKSI